jgi:hypothetical protein
LFAATCALDGSSFLVATPACASCDGAGLHRFRAGAVFRNKTI